jgi:hypothetical protein
LRESLKMEREMERGSLIGLMGAATKEILRMIRLKELGLTSGMMGKRTLVIESKI